MKKKRAELLSFVGGVVFFTVLVGIVVGRNDRIRNELENQAQSLLRVSRDALDQAQVIVARVKTAMRDFKIDSETSKYEGANYPPETTETAENDSYAVLWQTAETRNRTRG
jgi:hypothetical protein